jgi:hypothetical protein
VATASSSAEIRLLQRFQRHWLVTLLGLLATILLSVAALQLVPARYTAKADLLLTPPQANPAATANGNPNPYIQLGGLQPLADVVSRTMMSGSMRTRLHAKGVTSSYTVVRDTTTDGPILTVTTSAKSGAAALNDLKLILAAGQPELSRLQAAESVPTRDQVTIATVAADTVAGLSRKSQIRATLVAVVGGLVGTALAVSVLDMIQVRRRARSLRSRPVAAAASATPPTPSAAPATAATPAASHNGLSDRVLARSRAFMGPISTRRAATPHPADATERIEVVNGAPGPEHVGSSEFDAPTLHAAGYDRAAKDTPRTPPASPRHRPLPGAEPLDAVPPLRTTRRVPPRLSHPASGDGASESAETDAEAPERDSNGRVSTHSP